MVIKIVSRSPGGDTVTEERRRPASAIVLAMKLVETGLDVTIVEPSGQELTAEEYRRRTYPTVAALRRQPATGLTPDRSPNAIALSNAVESGATAMDLKGANILVARRAEDRQHAVAPRSCGQALFEPPDAPNISVYRI